MNGNLTAEPDGFDYVTDSDDDNKGEHDNNEPAEENENQYDGNYDDDDNMEIEENKITVPNNMTNDANKKLQREMRRLGGSWFNPLPEQIIDNATKQMDEIQNATTPDAPLGRDEVDEIQAFAMKTMSHLFGDFAFYTRDKMVFPKPKGDNSGGGMKEKLSRMHILDLLDKLNDENFMIPGDVRAGCELAEAVSARAPRHRTPM